MRAYASQPVGTAVDDSHAVSGEAGSSRSVNIAVIYRQDQL